MGLRKIVKHDIFIVDSFLFFIRLINKYREGDKMSFGNRLRQLRLENNMTQEDLSKKLKVSRATVGRYETDERFPDKNILKNIADIFCVSIDFLLERTNIRNCEIITKESSYELYYATKNYEIIEDKIKKKLVLENIIDEKDLIPKEMIDNIINYGIEAAIKIYLLENKLKKNK
jgi:transcriptional regulator with XRE-family HTH domain